MNYVYFIRAADGTGPVKIGCTADLTGRLYVLTLQQKKRLAFLAFAKGGFERESALHRHFAEHRVEGEWFAPSEPVLEFIDKVVRSNRLPAIPQDNDRAEMAALYRGGQTLQSIGDKFGLTRERVRQILRLEGVKSLGLRKEHIRKSNVTPEFREAVGADYAAGLSLHTIADKHGVSTTWVIKCADALGYPRRGKVGMPRKPETAAKAEMAADLYRRGYKTREIASHIGVPKACMVYRYLDIAGVERNRLQRAAPAQSQAA